MTEKTPQQLAECAARELKMRQRVYPRLVDGGRMSAADAEHELQCMKEILAVLQERAVDGFTLS